MKFDLAIKLWEGLKSIVRSVGNFSDKRREQKEWEQKSKNYNLITTKGGATVYGFIGSPHHYACPSCYSSHKIVPLQDARDLTGEFSCPACNARYPVNPSELHTGPVVGDDIKTVDEI